MAPNDESSSTNPLEHQQHMADSYSAFLHNTSLAMLFIAPALIALPPRKLDLYTLMLGGSFVVSANYLVKERTGAGLLAQVPSFGNSMPKRALEIQAQQQQRRLLEEPMSADPTQRTNSKPMSPLEQKAREVWMGGESEGWKERRLKEEQEKLDRGEGYGSMIMDQIREVWNWGGKKTEALEKKDQEVIAERTKKER